MPTTERLFGVFGFEFSRMFNVRDIELIPLFGHPESRARSADERSLHLTGYGRFCAPCSDAHADWERARLLAAGMTFAQQQLVATSSVIEMSEGDSVNDLMSPERLGRSIALIHDRSTFGAAIIQDVWEPASRPEFLRAFVGRFALERPHDALRQAFFRQLEISRLATPYVELHHFLAFSALELLARSQGPHSAHRDVAVPITDLLNGHGFGTTPREIELWSHARNRAFHNGLLVSIRPSDGEEVRLTEQLVPMTRLLSDVLLKLLPFDDGHINWNRWRDRMPFR